MSMRRATKQPKDCHNHFRVLSQRNLPLDINTLLLCSLYSTIIVLRSNHLAMGYKCIIIIIIIMFIYCIYSYTDIFRYFSTECLFSFQVLFSNGEKGVLSRTNFEWNKNDFSQLFRHTKNANEFIAVWRKNTTFNKITQSSEPLSLQLLPSLSRMNHKRSHVMSLSLSSSLPSHQLQKDRQRSLQASGLQRNNVLLLVTH